MAKTNHKGKTWNQHAAPYLRLALIAAAKTFKHVKCKTNKAKLKKMRDKRDKLNGEIKKEVNK